MAAPTLICIRTSGTDAAGDETRRQLATLRRVLAIADATCLDRAPRRLRLVAKAFRPRHPGAHAHGPAHPRHARVHVPGGHAAPRLADREVVGFQSPARGAGRAALTQPLE